jgi:FG-GAP-like repeat/PASTA domain
LNSDRRPDLAVAPGYLLVNRGHGTFGRARSLGVAPFALSDLNGDGKLDVAGGGWESVAVLLNKAGARLQAPIEYQAAGADDVAIADLNGDRRPDLVAATLDRVSVLINKPGVCDVQRLFDVTLTAARRQLARVNCRVGKVGRAFSQTIQRGRVISQKPAFGAVRPAGTKVNLVVSKGKRR